MLRSVLPVYMTRSVLGYSHHNSQHCLAVASVLLEPDLTANKQVILSDFTTSVLSTIEEPKRQAGEKWDLD